MSSRPIGIRGLGLFFAFGAVMSGLAFVSLLTPGGFLEPIWKLNPSAREALSGLRAYAIVLMGAVCVACALSAVGLVRQSRWGYFLAIAVLATNMLGDTANAIIRDDWRTLIGLPIGGTLIAYLLMPKTRRWFFHRAGAHPRAELDA